MNTFTDEYKSFKGPHVVSKKNTSRVSRAESLSVNEEENVSSPRKIFHTVIMLT